MRILLVEDEEYLNKVIKMNLEMEGYEVVARDNGKTALETAESQHFDLLILDIMLPEISGLQICEKVRLQNKKVGIIIISAKDTSQDRILGLKLGADDYLNKPFQLEELLLRVQNILRRSTEEKVLESNMYRFGENEINFATYTAKVPSGTIELTKKETLLLQLLVDKQNEVVSRNQILQAVWGYDVYPSTRTIDNFILALRKYFEPDIKNPRYFHSIRSVGYKFTP
jgi:two-component system alkaline phosphatase synthesis response regulator PhoP